MIVQLQLFSIGRDGNATARMKFKRDDGGGESFGGELKDAPAGTYELSSV